jgi:DNA ligase-associated metallophosphoesterase
MNRSPKTQNFIFKGQQFILYPEKIIYWKDRKTVICADLHLGKIIHFRKEGIALPQKAEKEGLERLGELLNIIHPEKVLFLGDLFHSNHNLDWLYFNDFIESYQEISFSLVVGNHDILEGKYYFESRLKHTEGFLEVGPFLFSHEPLEQVVEGKYNICGHIHPAVVLKGKARQRIKLPCFYFGDNTAILPAFGTFTGTSIIQPKEGEKIFIIADGKVLSV